MSRIISLPNANTASRVVAANSMKELLELLPIHVRPQMTVICERAYGLANKMASAGAQLDELEMHVQSNTLPPQIANASHKVQVCKEFTGQLALVSAHTKLAERGAAFAREQLGLHVDIKTAEFQYLHLSIQEDKWLPEVRKVISEYQGLASKHAVETPTPTISQIVGSADSQRVAQATGDSAPSSPPPLNQPCSQPRF